MDLSLISSPLLSPHSESKPSKPYEPNITHLKEKLIQKGVNPTPKILHALRKKQTHKFLRKSKKLSQSQPPPVAVDEEAAAFETIKAEYRAVSDLLELKGRPWERRKAEGLGVVGGNLEGFRLSGGKLKGEHLDELREALEERNGWNLRWLLDDDVEETGKNGEKGAIKLRGDLSEDEKIQLLVKRLTTANLSIQDWKFARVMKQSDILFSEMHLLKIIEKLGNLENWRLAMSVVEWVYNQKDYEHYKSRFVYTKLLSVLGKARRPNEACQIFNLMRNDGKLYPDMPAYHAIAVALGQAGLVNELFGIIECMKQKPSKRIKNMKHSDWDPCLVPDVVVFNAVLNACVPSHQWKGVSWVLQQMRIAGLQPTETTYGLAMEVMLKAGKYDRVHKYFETMRRGGLATKALTYKVLVKTLWEEGKIDEAVEAVRDMERRGVVGTASVYYELACCLCNKGRWHDAIVEVEKLKRIPRRKPLEVTFTGMILSSLDGGHPRDCISIFDYMKGHCIPNVGTINAMLKVYGCNDMFAEAKELFESIRCSQLEPDAYSYTSILEVSASARQWEYFEYVYREMVLFGFQPDRKKHKRLLIAASQAGKGHLLEHAFDYILEAAEVPCIPLLTELICQTIYQEDFGRTVNLINGMADALLQVSESQWSRIFRRNKDRFDNEKLQNLLNYVENSSNLVMEHHVACFLRSVKSFSLLLLATHEDDLEEDSVFSESVKGGKHKERIDGNLSNEFLVIDSHESASQRMHIDLVDSTRNTSKRSDSTNEGHSGAVDHWRLHSLNDRIDGSLSKLPSASDILDRWKKDRIKDGIFPFEYINS